MPNEVFADVTVLNNDGFQPGIPDSQEGIEIHKCDLTYSPQFRNPRINYQGVNVGWIVGPLRLEGDISGDLIYNTLAGIGAADCVTAFVFDFSFPDIGGGAIGGGNYFSEFKVSMAAEGAKLVTLDAKFTNDKNIP